MTFKPVGIDEDSRFPARVEAQLSATFVTPGFVSRETTGVTTELPGKGAGGSLHPVFVPQGGALITRAQTGFPSIYEMQVFCTDGVIEAPLARFYAYFSTDHDSTATPEPFHGKGGVGLAYGDSLLGPWTVHKDESGNPIIYQDTVLGNQTETPSPVIVEDDPDGKPIYIYYQQQNAPGTKQSTVLAKSATGLPDDFERVGIVIQGNSVRPGDGQTTYAVITYRDGLFKADHLGGGGNWAQKQSSYSVDGINFVTDPRRAGHNSHMVGADNSRRLNVGTMFYWRGKPWATATIGAHTSGFQTTPRENGVVRLSDDLQRPVGRFWPGDTAVTGGFPMVMDGKVYLFYRGGDAYSDFRVAIAEA